MLEIGRIPIFGENIMVAIYPHPLHGRLVERALLVLSRYRFLEGCWYEMTWRDGDYVYYCRAKE